VFYNLNETINAQFDYNSNPSQKEFTSLALSPSGQSVILGSFDKFVSFP
jgi:hypothetical protein